MQYEHVRLYYQQRIQEVKRYTCVHVIYSFIRVFDPDKDISHPYSLRDNIPVWWPPQVPYNKLSKLQDQGTALTLFSVLLSYLTERYQ